MSTQRHDAGWRKRAARRQPDATPDYGVDWTRPRRARQRARAATARRAGRQTTGRD